MEVGKLHCCCFALQCCLICISILPCLLLLLQPAGAMASDLTWYPTRPRHHHFNGAKSTLRAVHRTPSHNYHGLPPLSAPPPTAGADLPPLPPHGWVPSTPSLSPEPAPASAYPSLPTVGPAAPPVGSAAAPNAGEGFPFIGSNPTVPLPTGMTDTATVLPLPDRGDDNAKVVSFAAFVQVHTTLIGFVVMFSTLMLLLGS